MPPSAWKICPTWTRCRRSNSSRTANSACSSARTTRSIAVTTSRRNLISRGSDNFFSNYEPLPAKMARRIGRGRHPVSRIHRADADAHPRSRRDRQAGLFRVLRASADRGRQADQKSALPAKASRPGQSAWKVISRKSARACAAACRSDSRCADAGQRRAARPPQQSARSRHPLARVLQSDPLHGIAGAVHGIHLQHDRQIAFHDRRRFRRRADQRAVQRAAADHRSEQRARLLDAHRSQRLRHRRRLCRAEGARGPRREPASCRKFGAAWRRRNAIRNF